MIVSTDGGARGNPGPGACGAVVRDRSGKVIRQEGKFLGICTNNEAEYQGLILGLETVLDMGADVVEVSMDSELVVKQVKGLYRVKEPRLAQFFKKVKELEGQIGLVTYISVPREKNKLADSIVNNVLDEHKDA